MKSALLVLLSLVLLISMGWLVHNANIVGFSSPNLPFFAPSQRGIDGDGKAMRATEAQGGISAKKIPAIHSRQATSLIPPNEQNSLQTALREARHAVYQITEKDREHPQNREARYFAANPGQQLTARFLGDGVKIESGRNEDWAAIFRTRSIAGHHATPSPPEVQGSLRVEYAHPGTITEWYENLEEGFHHGFTLTTRPPRAAGSPDLELAVHVEGLMVREAAVQPGNATVLELADPITRKGRLRYGEVKAWDATGRELPAQQKADGEYINIIVADTGAQYPVTIDPLITSLEAELEPEHGNDGEREDWFGNSVALDGDTAVIGAIGDDTPQGIDAGSVYVFVRNGFIWTQQAKLTAEYGEAHDQFGGVVALDGNTLAVRALRPWQDIGSVYVFTRNNGTWIKQANLAVLGSTPYFGSNIALDGDTVLASDPGYSLPIEPYTSDIGCVYVFTRSDSAWRQQARITPPNPVTMGSFGKALSIDENTVLIGGIL